MKTAHSGNSNAPTRKPPIFGKRESADSETAASGNSKQARQLISSTPAPAPHPPSSSIVWFPESQFPESRQCPDSSSFLNRRVSGFAWFAEIWLCVLSRKPLNSAVVLLRRKKPEFRSKPLIPSDPTRAASTGLICL